MLVSDAAHFAGGIHYFTCLLKKCAACGHAVHCCSTAPKGLVLQHLAQADLLHALASVGPSRSQVTWDQDGVRHTVILSDTAQHDTPLPLAAAVEAAVAAAPAVARDPQQQANTAQQSPTGPSQAPVVILDADEASLWDLDASRSSSNSAATTSQQPCSFLGRLVTVAGRGRCLALVQNLYHLPWGPNACCGDLFSTADRPQAAFQTDLAQAWQQVGGYICVSQYVQQYVLGHAPSSPDAVMTCVVTPAAVGAFGSGPWCDFTEPHTRQLFDHKMAQLPPAAAASSPPGAAHPAVSQPGIADDASSSSSGVQGMRPTVGLLKCAPEKGSDLFFALASCLPSVNFLAVCGDPWVRHQMAALHLPNLKVVEPVPDVAQLLQQVHVVLVPSVLHEAFGMVVVDALLHGVPVIVSDAGALEEAACGAAVAVAPMPHATFPQQPRVVPAAAADSADGVQDGRGALAAKGTVAVAAAADRRWRWHAKQLPPVQQYHVEAWMQPLQQLFSSQTGYEQACRLSSSAALQYVRVRAAEEWSAFESWLLDVWYRN